MEEDVLDILLDEDNRDPIILANGKRRITFEQIAVIPMNERIYCVLRPIDKLEGVAEGEALVFRVAEDENGVASLQAENDELTAIDVFEEYYNLLEKADG